MLTPENDSVIVPPISAPRKNKRVIHGKLNIMDLFIIIPGVILLLTIIFVCKLEVWELLLVGVAIATVTGFLCWPLGFLGKDKPYIFILRGIKFLTSHRYLITENNDFSGVNTEEETATTKIIEKKEAKGDVIKDNDGKVERIMENEPQDFLTRLMKKRKNKKMGGKK
ncbi:MAG: hypothetical protein LBV53_00035 [Mycoplasmataceae bacterium]|nr:hypothetical protein [Mycoplasmataceae bacterium]